MNRNPQLAHQLPTCLALVFSDDIYICPSTGKRTILGTFSAVFAASYPTKVSIAVYCAFTDGMGETDLVIRLVRLSETDLEDRVILSAHGKVEFNDPRVVVELNMRFQQLELPSAGEYRFQVVAPNAAGEETLLERRLVAVQPTEPESDEENE